MGSLRDNLTDACMLLVLVVCAALLIFTLKMLLVHILCGLLFMMVAAFTLVKGQEARLTRTKLAWFVCTGAVFFLFVYWALKVVFPAPKEKESMGCGGVRFVDVDGKVIDLQNGQGPEDGRGGVLRTEL